jgi:hypothetical protein
MKTEDTANSILTKRFGGDGGDKFDSGFVRTLSLRAADEVDAIIVNDNRHGGDGGYESDTLVFDEDEYINYVSIRSGSRVDSLQFGTNKGRQIGGGGDGGDFYELDNIRVIAIGGRADHRLDQIQITYVENYVPSRVLQERARFVIAFTPPKTTLVEYTENAFKTTEGYELVTQTMLSQTYGASVEAEYYAKVAFSTEIQYVNTSISTISRELVQELKSGLTTKKEVGAGQVGVLLINGRIMQGADKKIWMYPTTEVSYAILDIERDWTSLLNHYDLTGELATQVKNLKQYMSEKDGYVFYRDDTSQ